MSLKHQHCCYGYLQFNLPCLPISVQLWAKIVFTVSRCEVLRTNAKFSWRNIFYCHCVTFTVMSSVWQQDPAHKKQHWIWLRLKLTIADICASCATFYSMFILYPKTICTTAKTLTFLHQASSAAVKGFEWIVNLYLIHILMWTDISNIHRLV